MVRTGEVIVKTIRITSITSMIIYNQNNRFWQNGVRCFCCHKEHVRVDCPIWKKVMEEEEKNSKLKVGINVAMVKWN
jgi:hypothetical protein